MDVDERIVTEVWERQALDASALAALGLRVVHRGVPSDAGGPDYQDVILSRDDREVLSGDIEFHVRSSDWVRHRHHLDSRYCGVILHVVWQDDARGTVNARGERVPTLEVGRAVRADVVPRLTASTVELLPHPCVTAFRRMTPSALRVAILECASRRFAERVDRLTADLESADPNQVAYGALLESLGFASNRAAFRELAEAVPYAWLQTHPSREWRAILLDAAGLGAPSPIPPPSRLPLRSWRLARLRPANHPARRVSGIAVLLARLQPHLSEALIELVLGAGTQKALRDAFIVREDGIADLGPGRVDEMVVSTVLPLCAALAPGEGAPHALYCRWRSPPPTRWTRLMQGLFVQAGHEYRAKTAADHQGVHFLYLRHCRLQRSAGCPVCSSQPAQAASGSMSYQSRPTLSSTSSGTDSS